MLKALPKSIQEFLNQFKELKATNLKLRESEQRFRSMVSAVKDYAIFMLDPDGHIVSWNEGAKRIKGYDATEVIGKHFSLFYLPEDIARNHPANELRIASRDGKYEEEGLRLRKDGTSFWASVVITRVDDENGKLLGFSKVTRDLTERKRAEELLREANQGLEAKVRERTRELEAALKVRDEFLSIASHELNTPLTSLKIHLQTNRRRIKPEQGILPQPEKLAYALDQGIKQVDTLSSLVADLLEVSRIQSGWFTLNTEAADLSELIFDILGTFSGPLEAAGCSTEVHLEPELKGQWDKRRLKQVIANLLTNATKYAPGTRIVVEAKREGSRAVLKIQDFGEGIPKEKQQRIFERFERVNSDPNVGGLGLGLFISRRILEAHKGRIWVESEVGQGTSFFLELPLSGIL